MIRIVECVPGGCNARRPTNSSVLVWGDNRRGYYDNDGAPYRHIDDVTIPGRVTSPPSTNGEAASHHVNIVFLSLTGFVLTAGYIRR